MTVIVLDAGHGFGSAHNRGGVCYNEGDNNFYYSLVLKAELERVPGFRVKLTRYKITDNPSLTQRGNIAAGADILISLHSDAFSKPSIRGTTVYDSVRFPNRELASALVNAIANDFGHNSRGVQFKEGRVGWDWYGVLRASRAKSAMIIEHGFHTNVTDCNYFKNNHKTLAKTTTKILDNHYNKGKVDKGGVIMSGNTTYYSRKVNNKGPGVRKLQQDLMLLKYNVGSTGADASFGPATEAAVRRFQKDLGLVVDGIAGAATLNKIKSLLTIKTEANLQVQLNKANAIISQIRQLVK